MNPTQPGRLAKRSLDDEAFAEQLLLKDRALAATAEGITISDPSLPDNPLIYANEGFERLTGYAAKDVIGRNCRFLQGPDTDPDTSDVIRDALQHDRACTVEILNYRKDGTPFWNRLSITPVRDASGEVSHFIGIQSDITAQKNAEAALRRAKQQLEQANDRMKQDLLAAARIQRTLLPEKALEVEGLELAWSFEPSTELAGDLLNVLPIDERRLALYVLDVSGHGVAAALLSVAVSRLLSLNRDSSVLFDEKNPGELASPARIVSRLNRHFPFDPRTAQYFTLIFGILDVPTRSLHYATAGHAPPILVPMHARPTELEPGGPPVGLLPEPEFSESKMEMAAGDRIVLYTDGVVEAEDETETQFGLDRFKKCLYVTRRLPLDESLSSVTNQVKKWCSSRPQYDDMTMLAFGFEPGDKSAGRVSGSRRR